LLPGSHVFVSLKQMNKVGTSNEPARVEWIKQTLKKIPNGWRILDAGAGELRFKQFCQHLDYVSQDFGKYDGSGDQKGLQTGNWDQTRLDIVCDIAQIPEADRSFDAIMCIEVFEHLPNPVLAIQEFSRLLKPGGTLIITAPFCSLTHFAPYHFATGFSRYFYEHHLAANGFSIEEITMNGNYFEYLAQELRRIPQVADLYSTPQISPIHKAGIKLVLHLLQGLSGKDRGSSELLAYGLHVKARKK
jgi:ubiquinone/menaquinone biosynthesis C-methylase UbiE